MECRAKLLRAVNLLLGGDRGCGGCSFQLSKSDDAASPVSFERRVCYAFTARRMIKTILVGDDAHVAEAVQKYQRTKFELLITRDRVRACPKAAGTCPGKIYPCFLKYAPDKTRAVISIRTGRTISISQTVSRFDGLVESRRCGRAISRSPSCCHAGGIYGHRRTGLGNQGRLVRGVFFNDDLVR